ncbi:type II/IV secretion system ATPase subunit [Candidatus Bathyarchaeota archaeon]|nr:type II/IV secretion system ATPase subunit [Candidatus Bathyarchaeota archaeon]
MAVKSSSNSEAKRNSSRTNKTRKSSKMKMASSPSGTEEEERRKTEKKPARYKLVESYWIHNPLAKVNIVSVKGKMRYIAEEAELNPKEEEAYKKLLSFITKELSPPETLDVDLDAYILSEAKRLAKKYRRSLGKFSEESWEKIYYYVIRDLAGYGNLDVLMNDPNIEDISCNGLNKPVYVWHRKYESLPTNIIFDDEAEYDNFIIKLAHMGGKHISSAHPMLDAMLPGKHRLAATFRREVSTFGSSFCIRKFREDPFSIVDLVKMGTIDETLAAYFWILLENKMSMIIIGGTGAGKTSMLNALISLIKPNDKIVTVEEISELNTLHENWVQLTSRQGFKFGTADETSISLFDLVKLSLRYRPDYIIVGEVRGEEAYALFQAVATGHGGICTMHADSLDHAVKRLTSEPMNVAEAYIPLMNVGIYVSRVELPRRKMGLNFGRRARKVWEILDYEKYQLISEWSPTKDKFHTNLEESYLLEEIAIKRGLTKKEVLAEVRQRKRFLKQIIKSGIRSQKEVTEAIVGYYNQARKNKRSKKRRIKRRNKKGKNSGIHLQIAA